MFSGFKTSVCMNATYTHTHSFVQVLLGKHTSVLIMSVKSGVLLGFTRVNIV